MFSPTPGSPQTQPLLRVQGLEWEIGEGIWAPISLDNTAGIDTAAYCGSRCHMVGAQKPGTGKTIPNPNVSVQPTSGHR